MSGNPDPFGKRLRVAMACADITNAALSKKIGVSRQMTSEMCAGKKSPSIATLLKLSAALNVSTGWLVSQAPFELPSESDGFHCSIKL